MNKNTFSCTQVCDAIAPDKGLWQPHLSSAGVCETGTLIGEVAEQTKDNAAFLRGYLSMLTDSVKKHLALGERVTIDGLCRFEIYPEGSLPAVDAQWDPTRNRLVVSCIPYDAVKNAAADIAPENTMKPVTVQLLGAQDATTHEQNAVVKGNALLCQGVGLNCRHQVSEDEGIFVIAADGAERKLAITDCTNVTLDATVPSDVPAGTYRLEVRSRAGEGKERTLVRASIGEFVIKTA